MIKTFFCCTDEIHRCDALQSSSIHHRIDRWEWSCPGGLPPSRITHEPQHDWPVLTWPMPVPYSRATHPPALWQWVEMLVISVGDQLPLTMGDLPWFSIWSFPIISRWGLLILLFIISPTKTGHKLCPHHWLSGFSKDLPTYKVNHWTISKKMAGHL